MPAAPVDARRRPGAASLLATSGYWFGISVMWAGLVAVLAGRQEFEGLVLAAPRVTWATATGASCSGGATQYAFTGRSIAIVVTRAASRGQLRIHVVGTAGRPRVDVDAIAVLK